MRGSEVAASRQNGRGQRGVAVASDDTARGIVLDGIGGLLSKTRTVVTDSQQRETLLTDIRNTPMITYQVYSPTAGGQPAEAPILARRIRLFWAGHFLW